MTLDQQVVDTLKALANGVSANQDALKSMKDNSGTKNTNLPSCQPR